jgi:CheY-like chemotaxis protein
MNPADSDLLASKILVVDDEVACVRLLERMLEGAGYSSVTSTEDPRLVTDLHRKNRYDLILLDLVMPGLDGFGVLEGLKEVEDSDYLSVLVMTGQLEHKERALESGAKDFIGKPLIPVEVLTRVRNLLELQMLHKQDRKHRRTELDTRVRTLLYVEDNAANLKLAERLIARRPDLRLVSARDGTEGVALARSGQPEVILMDINLPGISGLEALKILREDKTTRHIPVVALSANAIPRDIARGIEAGFFRYLTKPLRIDDFMDTLDVALAFAEQTRG